MADKWTGYFVAERITANLNEANWVLLVEELRQIVGNVVLDQPYERNNNGRGNVDVFEYEGVTYSNAYIFTANFNVDAIDFDKFQSRLVNLFGVDPEEVTYTTEQIIYRNRPTVKATYLYKTKPRITVKLMGCASDSELCTRGESNHELKGMLFDDAAEWGEIVE